MTEPAILVATSEWDPAPWAAAIGAAAPGRPVFVWPDLAHPDAVAYAVVWKPPPGALAGLPGLRAIFSLGAGVDPLMGEADLPDVPVVRMVDDDLTGRIVEWVVLQVLMHHRQQRHYDRLQRARRWHELPQPAAHDVRVGIMGMGVLGRAAAGALAGLGFRVAGWSRTAAAAAPVESFVGMAALDAFLARTDILVCLLPLTPETRGILAMPLFRKLATDGALGGPVLINAGRGGLQVEADIAAALEGGILGGASLDVFEQEPLDPASPLWGYESVVITPHCAGWTSPAALAPGIVRQIEAFEAGRPLANLVDRRRGY